MDGGLGFVMLNTIIRWLCSFLHQGGAFHFGGQVYFIQQRPLHVPRGTEARRPEQPPSAYG